MVFLLLILIALIISIVLLEVFLRKVSLKLNLMEFPKTDLKTLEKFKNYDEFLGWDLKYGGKMYDTHHSQAYDAKGNKNVAMYSINEDGSRWQPEVDHLNQKRIEFFGDSACFCREVNDNETFQHHLEKDHGIGPCKNFGVGNHGIDQAYLKAVQKMKGNGIAVLFMPIGSLYRVGTVYKNYSEPGNTWAIKPRFIVDDSELKLINRPFSEREELTDISKHSEHFRTYDNFYERYKELSPENKASYVFHFLKSKYAAYYLQDKVFIILRRRFGSRNKLLKIIQGFIVKLLVLIGKDDYYSPDDLLARAKGEEGKLFALISKKFSDLAIERGSTPLIVVSAQGWGVQNPEMYTEAISSLREYSKEQGVEIHDSGDVFIGLDEGEIKEYRADNVHLSPQGNEHMALWLSTILEDILAESNLESTAQ